jgi:hypothetical protein
MATVVIKQPNNDIMVGMSEHNPYKTWDKTRENIEQPLTDHQPVRVYFGSAVIRLNEEDLQNAVKLQNYAHVIKFVCIMDFFVAILNFVVFLNPFFFVAGLFNMFGYYGVVYFNHTYLHVYSVYQLILVVASAVGVWFMIQTSSTLPIVLTSLGTVFHLWMYKIVRNFVGMFPHIRITDAV